LLAIIFATGLFPESVSTIIGISSWVVQLSGALLFLIVIYWLAYDMKCPSCRTNLFWQSFSNAEGGNWFNWLLTANSCPKCGFSG
jgi:hypothetical protein